MTNEELIMEIRNGENIKGNTEQLCLSNTGLINKIALHYSSHEDIEDLRQEGYLGLMTAIELWNPEGGASFSTYAYQWIRQAISRYIENSGMIVRLPVHRKNRIYMYKKSFERFCQSFMKEPTSRELALYMGVSVSEIEKIKADAVYLNIKSMNDEMREDLFLEDTIADDNDEFERVLDNIQHEQLASVLWGIVDTLESNQSQVIKVRYQRGLTLRDSSDCLGMTKDKIRLLEFKALRKLREPKNKEKLKSFISERAVSIAYHSTGVGVFNRTWTSSTERAVLSLDK